MLTYTDVTVFFYKGGTFQKQIIKDVFLDHIKESTVSTSGLITIDTVSVVIPYYNVGDLKFDTGKDLLIHAIVPEEIDTTSEQSISESIQNLKQKYRVHIIKHCSPRLFGSKDLWHYALTCQ